MGRDYLIAIGGVAFFLFVWIGVDFLYKKMFRSRKGSQGCSQAGSGCGHCSMNGEEEKFDI